MEFRWRRREMERQYERLEIVLQLVTNPILFKSVLNHVLNHVRCDRLERELELICYCNAILFKLSQF